MKNNVKKYFLFSIVTQFCLLSVNTPELKNFINSFNNSNKDHSKLQNYLTNIEDDKSTQKEISNENSLQSFYSISHADKQNDTYTTYQAAYNLTYNSTYNTSADGSQTYHYNTLLPQPNIEPNKIKEIKYIANTVSDDSSHHIHSVEDFQKNDEIINNFYKDNSNSIILFSLIVFLLLLSSGYKISKKVINKYKIYLKYRNQLFKIKLLNFNKSNKLILKIISFYVLFIINLKKIFHQTYYSKLIFSPKYS